MIKSPLIFEKYLNWSNLLELNLGWVFFSPYVLELSTERNWSHWHATFQEYCALLWQQEYPLAKHNLIL